ncbi:hypothetical protein O3P69_014081 [Scylla paramamosain]|uniref:Uncharacterized protein n=1 Tax=Scylla paramamosain TaxID=85552 RepID=A0AAW0ST93_SCYPA
MLVLAGVTQLVLLCSIVTRAGAVGLNLGEVVHPGGGWEEDVAQAASQVVKRYLAGCHLVLAAPRPSRALPHLIRRLSEVGELAVFLQPCGDAKLLHGSTKEKVFQGNDGVPYFWREVWGSSKATCRAFLLDHTACGTDTAARLVSWSGLWLQPRTRVVLIGSGEDVNELFQHSALRNSLHVLYITRVVGTLQHEMADFSMDLTVTPQRAEVVEYSRAYIDESLVILSSKPKPLPEYLSVVRPLEGEVWGAIVMCVMIWGSVLWMMERLSHWISGRRYLSFTSSIFYGWGLLLEDRPFEPPSTTSSQIVEKEEGMARVLEGGFSYIDNYYFIKTLVSTYYTDRTGYTPVHISTTRYPLYGGNGWAFRKGAPFRSRINNGIQRFLDAGLITTWMDEVILSKVRREREALKEKDVGSQLTLETASDGQVVLGLSHLQGTFYTLFLGHTLASLSFFCEIVLRRR